MRVGLMFPPDGDQAHLVPLARWAESVGFDFFACGEHVFFHQAAPNAFVALAAAAGATQRIRLLSALTILPMYPAALAAKMIATLDRVSGGRFDFGVGVGGEYPAEFEACGVPVTERGRRTDEALTVLRLLLGGQSADFAGRYTTLRGQQLAPASLQQPGPPVWVGGRREAAMRRAGRHGDVWLPYLITPEQLAAGIPVVRSAAAEAGRSAQRVRAGVFCWSAVGADGPWATRVATGHVSALYQQDFQKRSARYLVTGTPAQVIARLSEYAAAGAEEIVFSPACPPGDLARMIESFATEVLPALRPEQPRAVPGRADQARAEHESRIGHD